MNPPGKLRLAGKDQGVFPNHPPGKGNSGNEDEKNVTWSDFTQETTFHGMKYIFDPSGLVWRRLLWSVVVVSSILVFTVQVSLRIAAYRNYDTSTDLSAVYPENLNYPAVSICNQNSFRISDTESHWNLYEFIDHVYKNRDTNIENGNINNVDTKRFFLAAAHQLSDLIERCEWKGHPCDIENDFIKVIGEAGVCYIFNSGVNRTIYTVEQAGSQSKLELILNAETYEHMRGPQNDAGIKIQLHNHNDLTQLETKGFMVAPGKHVMVRVEMNKATFLPQPYGDCDPDTLISRGTCVSKCRVKAWARDCGCTSPFMEEQMNDTIRYKTCSALELFKCMINKQVGLVNMTECICPAPCEWTEYTPLSSFADLSKYNIQRMVFDDTSRETRVYDKFMTANEVRSKVVTEIWERDATLIKSFNTSVVLADEVIQRAVGYFDTDNLKLSVENLSAEVAVDKDALNKSMVNLWWRFARVVVDVNSIVQTFQDDTFPTLMVHHDESILEKLKNCSQSEDMTTEFRNFDKSAMNDAIQGIINSAAGSMVGNSAAMSADSAKGGNDEAETNSSLSSINDWLMSSFNLSSTSRRKRSVILERHRRDKGFIGIGDLSSGDLSNSNLTISSMDGDSGISRNDGGTHILSSGGISFGNKSSSTTTPSHISSQQNFGGAAGGSGMTSPCTDLLNVVSDKFRDNYAPVNNARKKLTSLLDKYEKHINGTYSGTDMNPYEISEHLDCIHTLGDIQTFYDGFYLDTVITSPLTEYDDLLVLMSNLTEHAKLSLPPPLQQGAFRCFWIQNFVTLSTLEKMLKKLNSAINALYSMPSYSFQLEPLADDIAYLIRDEMNRAANATQMYMNEKKTKYNLAEAFDTVSFEQALSTIADKTSSYKRTAESMLLDFRIAEHQIKEVMEEVFDSKLPLMNGEELMNLRMRALGEIDGYQINGTGTTDKILEMVEWVFLRRVGYDINNITEPVYREITEMTTATETLSKPLSVYLEESDFTSEVLLANFLKVDIFFDELKWTQVTQRESFGILSLFGEIGGFLGLLLGASVLTVCELLDFLSTKLSRAFKKRKQNKAGSGLLNGNRISAW